MRIICAWCQKVMEEGEGPASHGICLLCLVRVLRESGTAEEDIRKILEKSDLSSETISHLLERED